MASFCKDKIGKLITAKRKFLEGGNHSLPELFRIAARLGLFAIKIPITPFSSIFRKEDLRWLAGSSLSYCTSNLAPDYNSPVLETASLKM
uniref:Uncharacterized protein n=1 Tax=Megaselia scalaris TaxID=36166 RepID=T1H2K6_MEGSC